MLLCAGFNGCYVGETTRHFSKRIREQIFSDRTSHSFKQLQNSQQCHSSCSIDYFRNVDHASTTFYLKPKEAIYEVNLKTFLVIFYIVMFPFVLIAISALYTAAWLAQLVERQSVVREVKPLSVPLKLYLQVVIRCSTLHG